MVVIITAYGGMKKYANGLSAGNRIEVPAGANPAFVFRLLEMPSDFPIVFFVNGRVFERDRALVDGDEIVFFSPMEGG